MQRKVLVTGGCGFIGSNLIRTLVENEGVEVVNVDKLTYAANPASLNDLQESARYRFERADVADAKEMARLFAEHRPDCVMHLAAESHVDRSIDAPSEFVQTNVVGTTTLLDAALCHYRELSDSKKADFRFLHVSTDEVFGSLGDDGVFTEHTAYDPNSPYAASKAASDHLARSWHRTFGLPVIISNCSNNYGPYQFPEKLIPLMIIKALAGEPLPVYGTGKNVRDWLYVVDHARALWRIVSHGEVGATYLIGGRAEKTNIDIVETLCDIIDELSPTKSPRRDLITFVADRPGHDHRYAIDPSHTESRLEWTPDITFEDGIKKTVHWYLEHEEWWRPILDKSYRGQRLGLGSNDQGAAV